MRVLVTGGAGFIGSNLCKHLTEESDDFEVRVIDDLSTGRLEALDGLRVDVVEASILDETALERAADGCAAIVHLAALGSVPRSVADPVATHEANATGSLKILEVARRNDGAHVVLASSSSVYGANPALPKVETLRCQPLSPYAVSKLAAEQYAMAYANCYGLPVLPFRFFNVFGPGQMPGHAYAAVIPVFLEAALNGRPLPVNGDGEQSRDFTYVGTVVETITTALAHKITGGPANLAFGTRTTLNELIAIIADLVPGDIEVTRQEPRMGDVLHSQADHSVLTAMFPEVVPIALEIGLERTVDWMSQYLGTPLPSQDASREKL